MSLITVERIKLFSTRSPWWCMIIAAVLSIGLAALATGFAHRRRGRGDAGDDRSSASASGRWSSW